MFKMQHAAFAVLFAVCAFQLAHCFKVEQPGGEAMSIDIGCRSYDGSMWVGANMKPHKYDQDAYKTDPEGYIASLPEGARPVTRMLADFSEEPDFLDDGNCWVAVTNADGSKRNAYMISSDGYHAVCTKTEIVRQVEDISGEDYIKRLKFKTVPTTYSTLEELGSKLAGDKSIHEFGAGYLGTDFVIDFVSAIISPEDRKTMRLGSAQWPRPVQLIDKYYRRMLGRSAFGARQIPIDKTPVREHMSHTTYVNAGNKQTAVRA